jgi:hypothetical protein
MHRLSPAQGLSSEIVLRNRLRKRCTLRTRRRALTTVDKVSDSMYEEAVFD